MSGDDSKDRKASITTGPSTVHDYKDWIVRQFGGGKRQLTTPLGSSASPTEQACNFVEPTVVRAGAPEFGVLVADRGMIRSVGGSGAGGGVEVLCGNGKEDPVATMDASGGAMPSGEFVFRGPVRAMTTFVPTSEDWSVPSVIFFTDGGNQIWALQLSADPAHRPVKAYGKPVASAAPDTQITGLACDTHCNLYISIKKGAHIYKMDAPATKEDLKALIPGGASSGQAYMFSGAMRENAANAPGKMMDGSHKEATFHSPCGMVVDVTSDQNGGGYLYVADAGYHAIRRVDTKTGAVTTVSGREGPNHVDGPVNSAQFSEPVDVALSRSGGHLIVSDCKNFRVRLIDLKAGQVSTVVGSGFKSFSGKDLDSAWNWAIGEVRSVAVQPTNGHVWLVSPTSLVAEALPPIKDEEDTGCRMCGAGNECVIM